MAIRKRSQEQAGREKPADVKGLRRTAGMNVAISIAAAAVLLVVVNVIGSAKSYRRDLETLGSYGLSETAKRILDQVDQPVRLTSIYTSTRSDRKPEQYLPRLKDLMEEMRRRRGSITVVNVTSDRQKADVVARLRQRLDEASAPQRKVIADFQLFADRQAPQYEQMARQWAAYPASGWLSQFGTGKALELALRSGDEELRKLAGEQRQQLSGSSLPDYPAMVGQVRQTLTALESMFGQITKGLRDLAALPEQVAGAQEGLKKVASATTVAAEQVVANLAPTASGPGTASAAAEDPSALLDSLSARTLAVARAAVQTRGELEKLAASGYVEHARAWRIKGQTEQREEAEEEEATLPGRYAALTADAYGYSQQMQGLRQLGAKVEIQRQFLAQMRRLLPQLLVEANRLEKDVSLLLAELTSVDEPTRQLFQQVRKTDYLQDQTKPVADLLQATKDLPKLEEQKELIEQIDQDNIVLVEVANQCGVVSFEEVWPLAARPDEFGPPPEETERRTFYGDMAISSKILSLASKPFAQVVLTYFERVLPRMAWQQVPPIAGPIYSMQLRTLRERLEKANLKVTDWNLAQQPEPPADDAESPPGAPGTQTAPARKPPLEKVLLVLPPPEPSPMPMMEGDQRLQWGEEHLKHLADQISRGTPAIFLAGYFRPAFMGQLTGPAYVLGDYLRKEWGLDVKTNLRVIQGEPDALGSGTFTLPVLRWSFLPLSSFTNTPIGRPLQARRLYWLEVCPVVKEGAGRSDTAYSDILVVPAGRRDTWASAQPEKILQRLFTAGSSGIRPETDAGDLEAPFALAVQASRKTDDQVARIVVLGVGFSYVDSYLNMPVLRLTGETLTSDPPTTGDVDLVVNSVYDLVGKGEFIGAGPAIIQPIRLISPTTMTAVKLGFGIAWPALMVAVGIVVMLIRRR